MEIKVKVVDIINTGFAISPVKGEEIFKEVERHIPSADIIKLDFGGVSNVTTAFLNRAIGNLYNEYDKDMLNEKISYIGLDELDRFLLDRVISHALLTDEQKNKLNKTIEEAMSDEQGN